MHSDQFLYDYPLLDIELTKNSKKLKVTCIIDTGSPYTLIPIDYLNNLNIDESDQFTKLTIHGVIHKEECSVEVPGYAIDLSIGDISFEKCTVFCYEFLQKYGLIGHNILSQCNLFIDWNKKKIIIEK